jgi:hypothetical protein
MKAAARIISFLFHPLLMPTLGLLLILNSGTYMDLLDPTAKRALLFVMAMGTLIFPLMMVPMLYYRRQGSAPETIRGEEELLSRIILLVLYIITFVYFVRLPLNRLIHAYTLSLSILLLSLILISLRFRICSHTTALGGISGLVISLVVLYETPLLGILAMTILAAGLTGSARLLAGLQRPVEVYAGFFLGFSVVMATLLVY